MSATACAPATSSRASIRRTSRLQVESAEAELAAATSNLAQAAADLERYTTLKGNAASPRSPTSTARRRRTTKPKAGSQRAKRALDLARNQLGYADLKADADGVITATLAEPGQVVAIGQAVARLAHRGEKEAVVALPETWLGEARKAKATVRLWSDRDRSFEARLRELSPQADAATRTYAARFTIADAGRRRRLRHDRDRDAVARSPTRRVARLPLSAILNRGSGPSVYVVDQTGALVLRPVTVAVLHRERGAGHLRHQRRRPGRHARRAEARSGPQGPRGRSPTEADHGSGVMKRFNLSEWAITHRPLVLFMILLLGAAGAYSYFNLGRAEDPSFTIKVMVVHVAWPGATAAEMQTQVADKIEKKLQELPYLDRVESYSQPGVAFIRVQL